MVPYFRDGRQRQHHRALPRHRLPARSDPPLGATETEGRLEMPIGEGDLDRSVARMTEQGWLAPHPIKPGAYLLTETREDVVEHVFKGFVRFIDAGENRWDSV